MNQIPPQWRNCPRFDTLGCGLAAAAVVTFQNDIEATCCLAGIIVLSALLLIHTSFASNFHRGASFNFATSSL
jgi:hypothetical protein